MEASPYIGFKAQTPFKVFNTHLRGIGPILFVPICLQHPTKESVIGPIKHIGINIKFQIHFILSAHPTDWVSTDFAVLRYLLSKGIFMRCICPAFAAQSSYSWLNPFVTNQLSLDLLDKRLRLGASCENIRYRLKKMLIEFLCN